MKIQHTPYDGSAKPFSIGLRPLDLSDWIDVDENFDNYIAEKKRLYTEEFANVLVAEAGTEMAQREVYELIEQHLSTYHSSLRRGPEASVSPTTTTSKSDTGLNQADPHLGALAQAGLLVQEDLVLMRKSPEGWRLVAASLCFPSAWNLREKFGRPLHEVHGPVPGFNAGTRNAALIERMFDNLKPEQPVLRWNWSLYSEARLYHPATNNADAKRFADGSLRGQVVLRLERQTLRKLPQSGDILFTIRIYLDPIEVLERHDDGPRLAMAIAEQLAALSPDEIGYKGLSKDRERLLARLREIAVQ
jgi:hypothetical protein